MKAYTVSVSPIASVKHSFSILTLWGNNEKDIVSDNLKRGYDTKDVRPFDRERDIPKKKARK